jgi:hypothetical protein
MFVKLNTTVSFSFVNKNSECLCRLGIKASIVAERSVHLKECVCVKRGAIKRVELQTFQSRFVKCSVLGI